jgi:Pyruvate/2-oxoacid:ferredoxin oxidoreductase gamma subunit
MVMLDAAQDVTKAVSKESLIEAIKQRSPRYTELNIKALRRGIEPGKQAMGEE